MSTAVERAVDVLAEHQHADAGLCLCTCGWEWSPDESLATHQVKTFRDAGLLVTPDHNRRVKVATLREAVEEHTVRIPDVLGYKVQAVFVEDLLDRADAIERGEIDE